MLRRRLRGRPAEGGIGTPTAQGAEGGCCSCRDEGSGSAEGRMGAVMGGAVCGVASTAGRGEPISSTDELQRLRAAQTAGPSSGSGSGSGCAMRTASLEDGALTTAAASSAEVMSSAGIMTSRRGFEV